jgi:hypothetical protein
MCEWVMQVGELLRPIRASMRLELLRGDCLQADETPLMNSSKQGFGSRIATLTMVFKLGLEAQKHWAPAPGFRLDLKDSYRRSFRRW